MKVFLIKSLEWLAVGVIATLVGLAIYSMSQSPRQPSPALLEQPVSQEAETPKKKPDPVLVQVAAILESLAQAALNETPEAPKYLKYKFRKGESLGRLLDAVGLCPLWGNTGSVQKTIQINEGRINKDRSVEKSTIIILPTESLRKSRDYTVNDDGFLTFLVSKRKSQCSKPKKKSPVAEKPPEPVKKAETPPVQKPIQTPALERAPANSVIPEQTVQAQTTGTQVVPEVADVKIDQIPAEQYKAFSILEIAPVFTFTRLDGVDTIRNTSSILISGLNYGFRFSATQVWSDRFKTIETLGLQEISLLPSNQSVPILNSAQTYSQMGLGFKWKVFSGSDIEFGSMATMQQDMFSHGNSTSAGLQIDRLFVPKLELNSTIPIFKRDMLDLTVELKGFLLLPATSDLFTVNMGSGYGGKLWLGHEFTSSFFKVGASYLKQNQTSSIFQQQRTDLGIEIAVGWAFGKPANENVSQ